MVFVERAAGVNTTVMSRPPDARMGATSIGYLRLWEEGRMVYGGHIAKARTSCACSLREADWTQRLAGDFVVVELFCCALIYENWVTF